MKLIKRLGLLAVIVITVTAPALAQSSIGGAHKPAAVVGGPVASHNPVVPPQRGTAPPPVSGAIQPNKSKPAIHR